MAIITSVTLCTAGIGALAVEARPTTSQLDDGLLTKDDVLAGFEETDRRPLDASSLADTTRGPCNGPNTMAIAVGLDDAVKVATVAFGTEAGASLTEDAFAFANAKQATSFIKKYSSQQKSCDSWKSQIGSNTTKREFTVTSIVTPHVADQALEVDARISPTSTGATGFDGVLIRQTILVRVGSVSATLTYLRSSDFRSRKPGSGYPASAVAKLQDAL